jgi:hypothetical protein|tara:strand:+ start:33334 stop:34041 length:708 start_codon:yes stop_codon:yes gene_type:complete
MIEKLKLPTILRQIKQVEEPFTFSRWGDGEWRAVLRRNKNGGKNCDGHQFFSGMGAQLANVLIGRPEYLLGMQNLAMRIYGKPIQAFLAKHELTDLRWYTSDVFHYGAIYGNMQDILDTVNSRKVLLVGPPHLKKLKNNGLKYWDFIEIPPRNNYLVMDETYRSVLAKVESETEPLLISLSASMPAEILCDKLYDRIGKQHTIIDFGSLWDPLVGVKSRSYMKNKKTRPRRGKSK